MTNSHDDHSVGKPELLRLVAIAESGSEHPLGQAVVRKAREEQEYGILVPNPDSFEALSGHGVRAIYSGHTILVGNRKLMDDNKIPVTDKVDSILEQLEKEGKTPLRGEQSPKYCPKLYHHSCFMKLGLFSTRVL